LYAFFFISFLARSQDIAFAISFRDRADLRSSGVVAGRAVILFAGRNSALCESSSNVGNSLSKDTKQFEDIDIGLSLYASSASFYNRAYNAAAFTSSIFRRVEELSA